MLKQKKRHENLKARMTKNKRKQMNLIKNRPGFEGNGNGFIN